ncbi:MAG: FMN-binding protein [Cycloclasticus sp. symbiont of Poecilosclerida sp. M]|nr:MAG: FMN-binding protein [Cycloclasticus sp. symbiont of Poecilosclerida sp. M]
MALMLASAPLTVMAKGVYQTEEAFLNEAFEQQVPKPLIVWINKEKKQAIENILQHRAAYIRLRYWQQGEKTAWIINEIGKEKPITVGVIINNNEIEKLKVLSFRESRGWEVKHDFFTRQFDQTELVDDNKLSQTIDGISGATLSVRALKKIARIALYLNQQTQ